MKFPIRLTTAALLLCGAAAGATADDELWLRAMAHAAPENARRAEVLLMTNLERDNDGQVIGETDLKLAWNGIEGRYVLLSAFEDGEDVTERELRRNERRDRGDSPFYLHQMFNPEKAEGLTLSPRPVAAVIDGRECRIYDYRFEDEWKMGPGNPKPVAEEGMLFLESETGMPLRISSVLEEGPRTITSLTYRLEADMGPDGKWMPEVMEMDYAGRFFVRRAGGVRMEFIYGE